MDFGKYQYQEQKRSREAKLHPSAAARVQRRPLEQRCARHDLGRACMDLHGFVMGNRLGGRNEDLDARGEHRDRDERARSDDDHAALELVLLDADEVQGDAAARARGLQPALMSLNTTDPRTPTGRSICSMAVSSKRAARARRTPDRCGEKGRVFSDR